MPGGTVNSPIVNQATECFHMKKKLQEDLMEQ